jgi:hypothetical protein
MNNEMTPVILVVENHWLLGKLRTSDQRVLDILNDPQTDYLDLQDVKVFSSMNRQKCLAGLPTAIIPKESLHLLIIPTDKFEGSRQKRIHRIVEKKALDVCTVAAGYLVQGKLHIKSHGYDARYTLTHVLGNFFPITDAILSGPGTDPITVSTVMTNKNFVSALSCISADGTTAVQSTAGFTGSVCDIDETAAPQSAFDAIR